MAGNKRKNFALIDKADDLFGSEIGYLVESLLLLGGATDAVDRIYLKVPHILNLTEAERWIFANVGLPKDIAPHLSIQLKLDSESDKIIIADIQNGSEILIANNGIIWRINEADLTLNASCDLFFKSIILYSHVVEQSLLIRGLNAITENIIPNYLKISFIASLNEIDSSSVDAWLKLTEKHWGTA